MEVFGRRAIVLFTVAALIGAAVPATAQPEDPTQPDCGRFVDSPNVHMMPACSLFDIYWCPGHDEYQSTVYTSDGEACAAGVSVSFNVDTDACEDSEETGVEVSVEGVGTRTCVDTTPDQANHWYCGRLVDGNVQTQHTICTDVNVFQCPGDYDGSVVYLGDEKVCALGVTVPPG